MVARERWEQSLEASQAVLPRAESLEACSERAVWEWVPGLWEQASAQTGQASALPGPQFDPA